MPPRIRARAASGTVPDMRWRAAACGLMLLAGLSAQAKSPRQDIVPLALTAKAVALDERRSSRARVGALRYMGGLHVTADSALFGGLSGLALSADGGTLIAVADTGYWFIADLIEDEKGWLVGLRNAVMADLLRPDGLAPQGRAQSDAEALVLDDQHGLAYVAFENRHRVWAYAYDPARNMRQLLRTPATPVDIAGALAGQPGNGGVETLFWIENIGLLGISEELGDTVVGRVGWRLVPGPPFAFRYGAPLPYVPTDAAVLPDGRVLILNRRAGWLSGFAAKLLIADIPALAPGGVVTGQLVARLGAPLIADNFEGVAARRDDAGRTVIYLISDDNFNPLQRTLLLKFMLDEAAMARAGAALR
ncbi:MAG: hypothetical protein D6782_09930 [Alphaproteobacteria bacterium]|nr:MAG: hypothetical protein D6782_09930 [Alphaproteobacteria bacterium]